jgi:hypothetical protein
MSADDGDRGLRPTQDRSSDRRSGEREPSAPPQERPDPPRNLRFAELKESDFDGRDGR